MRVSNLVEVYPCNCHVVYYQIICDSGISRVYNISSNKTCGDFYIDTSVYCVGILQFNAHDSAFRATSDPSTKWLNTSIFFFIGIGCSPL